MIEIRDANLENLKLVRKGKVRDIYDLGDKILFVATDRVSAFDVIMNQIVPLKGCILNAVSLFWFNKTSSIFPNHLIESNSKNFPVELNAYKEILDGRAIIVEKLMPLPVEFVVRGYIAGSGWKEYQKTKTICGEILPEGFEKYSKLPQPIFTPSTKAMNGHDENISFDETKEILGGDLALRLKNASIKLFNFASEYLYERGIILADTKFEFGARENGQIVLIDEVLTPDSSRFWVKDSYQVGVEPESFDKQVLRDYLEKINWDKDSPAPDLPDFILDDIRKKYEIIHKVITGEDFSG